MPIISAAALRREVLVSVPGTDLQIRCRRPDLLTQIAKGVLSQTLVQEALKAVKDGMFDLQSAAPDTVAAYGEFIDRWACVAALEPRIVQNEADAGETAVWVEELSVEVKTAIFNATIGPAPVPVTPAVTDFRHDEPAGIAGGPDGEAVRH